MSSTDRVRNEAYASAPINQPIRHVVELDTPAFDKPLFFIADGEDDVNVRLEDGRTVLAIACAFECIPPGFDDTGPTTAQLKLDNVSSLIFPYLKQATSAINVTYRAYLGNDLTNVVDLIDGLLLRKVTLGGTTASGELTFAEIATQAFPRRTYDIDTYPGLWNS